MLLKELPAQSEGSFQRDNFSGQWQHFSKNKVNKVWVICWSTPIKVKMKKIRFFWNGFKKSYAKKRNENKVCKRIKPYFSSIFNLNRPGQRSKPTLFGLFVSTGQLIILQLIIKSICSPPNKRKTRRIFENLPGLAYFNRTKTFKVLKTLKVSQTSIKAPIRLTLTLKPI